MASESETWWTKHYTSHSIRDMQSLPIFNKFISMHFDYERTCDDRQESYTAGNTLDVFRWEQKDSNQGETFSHDRKTEVWFYERKFPGEEAHTVTRTWLSPDAEWGEIERTFLDFSIKESWKMKGSTRHYERCTLRSGEKRGLRTGCLPAQGGMEEWTETYWEKDGESEFERVWERPGASGGENKHNRGDYWWGEVWHRVGNHTEKKSWHTKGDKDWGHVHGEAPNKVWDEKWDISKTRRDEEKLTQDNGRCKGYRLCRKGPDFYKQEWDGLSLLNLSEGTDSLQTAKIRQELDEISGNSHDNLLKSEHTVELLLREAPEFKGESEELRKARVNVPKPNSQDVESLIAAVRAERELGDKLERLKQRMVDSIYADHGKFYELHNVLSVVLAESQTTLEKISEILKTDPEATKSASDWSKKSIEIPKIPHLSAFSRTALYSESLQSLEKAKIAFISKLQVSGDESLVGNLMGLLYQTMVKHSAVSDKVVELVGDEELKGKLAALQEQYEANYSKFQEKAEGKLLTDNLELLLAYQPIHLHLISRVKPSTDDQPPQKGARGKPRAATLPTHELDQCFSRVIPFIVKVNDVIRGKEDLGELLALDAQRVDDGAPVEVVGAKGELVSAAVDGIDPKLDSYHQAVKSIDQQLDSLLQSLLPTFKKDAKAACEALLGKHYETEDLTVLASKVGQLKSVERTIKDLKSENEELEMIIEQKSEEITSISTMMDEEKQKKQDLEDEVLELRKKQG